VDQEDHPGGVKADYYYPHMPPGVSETSSNFPPFLKGGRGDFMALPFDRNLKSFARELRKNMTDAERAL
jgi:hypothetical protein